MMHVHTKLAIEIMSNCSQLYFVDAANCCVDAPICLVGKQSQHNIMSFACTSQQHSTARIAYHVQLIMQAINDIKPTPALSNYLEHDEGIACKIDHMIIISEAFCKVWSHLLRFS